MYTRTFIFILAMYMCASQNLYAQQSPEIKHAQETSWQGKYQESIDEYDKILVGNPKDLDALEGKADVLSWMGQYKASVKVYDQYLEQKFSSDIARKKARVLAWGQYFCESLKAYKEAYERSKSEAIRYEMLGKKNWWDNHITTAIENYNEALKLEPDNLEARYDVAQIEAQARLVDEATENFEYITKKYDWHTGAKEGLEKLNIIYKRPYVMPQFSWFSAISPDRFTEVRRLYSELMFGVPFAKNYDVLFGYGLDDFNYDHSPSIIRHYGLVGLKASLNARLWLSGLYGATAYTSNNVSSQRYNVQAGAKIFDPLIMTMFMQREDLINSSAVLTSGLHSTDVGLNAKIDENRYLVSTLEYKRSFVNDTNRTHWIDLEQLLIMLQAPTELTLTAKFQYQDWKTVVVNYFSPQRFWQIPIILRWRHYLNKGGLYFGAKDTYYGFRYQFQVDRGHTIYNGLGAEFHHDFTKSFGLHYDVFGDYSNVYKDFGMSLGFVGYF